MSGTSISEHISPGPRPDNLWMQYSYENRPLTAEQWNQPKFIYKPSLGYYCWPKYINLVIFLRVRRLSAQQLFLTA